MLLFPSHEPQYQQQMYFIHIPMLKVGETKNLDYCRILDFSSDFILQMFSPFLWLCSHSLNYLNIKFYS